MTDTEVKRAKPLRTKTSEPLFEKVTGLIIVSTVTLHQCE